MNVPDHIREMLTRKGIDPALLDQEAAADPLQRERERLAEYVAETLTQTVPVRFRDAVAEHPDVLAWIDSFARDPRSTPSLLLLGPTGVGKTHHAFAALRDAVVKLVRATGSSTSFWSTTHPRLVADARPQPDGAHHRVIDRCEQVMLLLVDDLGAVRGSAWSVAEVVYRVLDYRWAHRLPGIYTSNLTPAELRDVLGDRVVSRIGDGLVVTLGGSDRRLAGRRS